MEQKTALERKKLLKSMIRKNSLDEKSLEFFSYRLTTLPHLKSILGYDIIFDMKKLSNKLTKKKKKLLKASILDTLLAFLDNALTPQQIFDSE